MRAIVQRVLTAEVKVSQQTISKINHGLLILLGIESTDTQDDIAWLSSKIIKMRIFNDADGVMNRSLLDIDGDAIIVSQFTLFASTQKGNRPSYIRSAKPEFAQPLYENFIANFENGMNKKVGRGKFGAHMEVSLTNDGPVTIFLDTKNKE